MREEQIERLLLLLLAAEVRHLAVGIRSRAAMKAHDDSINNDPLEHYLPAAVERLEPIVSFLRQSSLIKPGPRD